MQHLEGTGKPVLYIGRMVLKCLMPTELDHCTCKVMNSKLNLMCVFVYRD
jgi:hypothetical protein